VDVTTAVGAAGFRLHTDPVAECGMGRRMKLIQLIRNLDALDEQSTIYASQPWSDSSEAIAAYEPETRGIPAEAEELDLKYFLEVFIARNLVQGWAAACPTLPTVHQTCARLIEYAINDK
jgi:hypothetical protein